MKKDYQTIVIILIVVMLIIFVRLLWWDLPLWQVDQVGISTNSTMERANLENQYRLTIVQTLGGIVVIVGLFFTYEKILTLKDGQVTERFTRAIEHLGKEHLELKLGGIYALERIAKESKTDYWPIMEILTAYVRKNSGCDINGNLVEKSNSLSEGSSDTKEVSMDIQAILTVIKRRKYSFDDGEPYGLDLQNTYLYKADLTKVHLKRADLSRANLSCAKLIEANLEGANLRLTNFTRADLREANLKGIKPVAYGSRFKNAHLEKAHLEGTDLEMSDLNGAHLEGAYFEGAKLKMDSIKKAHYQGAHFKGSIIDGVMYHKDDIEPYY
jgi:uncharacterized protein YjbI with pentapeptide repeats